MAQKTLGGMITNIECKTFTAIGNRDPQSVALACFGNPDTIKKRSPLPVCKTRRHCNRRSRIRCKSYLICGFNNATIHRIPACRTKISQCVLHSAMQISFRHITIAIVVVICDHHAHAVATVEDKALSVIS